MIETSFSRLTATRYGPMLYLYHDTFIGRSLEVYGEVNEIELQLLRSFCSRDAVVFDVGAHIGGHTLALARQVGERGFVYAFEAQRIVFQLLCANVALNSLTNVECVFAAVGSEEGSILVPDIDYAKTTNYGHVELAAVTEFGGRPVRRVKLDEYAYLPRVDLVKIDVEGMERDVLLGARTFINRFRPVMYVENDRPAGSAELITTLWEMGYRLFWHLPAFFNPQNFRDVAENVFPEDQVAVNLMCVPRELRMEVQADMEVTDPHLFPSITAPRKAPSS